MRKRFLAIGLVVACIVGATASTAEARWGWRRCGPRRVIVNRGFNDLVIVGRGTTIVDRGPQVLVDRFGNVRVGGGQVLLTPSGRIIRF